MAAAGSNCRLTRKASNSLAIPLLFLSGIPQAFFTTWIEYAQRNECSFAAAQCALMRFVYRC